MKFSESTLKLLENFNTINTGIHFRKGHVLTSVHPQKTIMAQVTIAEEIPQNFVIYNIGTFLSAISLLKDPTFKFHEDKVVLKSSTTSITYGFADPSTVKGPPDKEVTIGKADVEIELTAEQISLLFEAAASLKVPDLKVEPREHTIRVVVFDSKDPSSHSYELDTGVTDETNFCFLFKVANLKILSGNYKLAINITAAHFVNKDLPLQYWVAVEKDSKARS